MRTCTTRAQRACCPGDGPRSTKASSPSITPTLPPERAAIGVAGFGGPISYFWPMLRSVVLSARRVAVHNPLVAAELHESFDGADVDVIRLGVADPLASAGRVRMPAPGLASDWASPRTHS